MSFIYTILNGFSQIFFQENIALGILIGIGLFIASPLTLILALLGNISSVITSYLVGVPKDIINTGFYSFNGVLIGTMVAFYIKQLPLALVITLIASILGTLIFSVLFKNHIHPFAFPFAVIGWILVGIIKFLRLG